MNGRRPLHSTTSTRGPADGHNSSVTRRPASRWAASRAGERDMTTCKSSSLKKRASTWSSTSRNADSTIGHSVCEISCCRSSAFARAGRVGVVAAAVARAPTTRWPGPPSRDAGGSLSVERNWSNPLRTELMVVLHAKVSTAGISSVHRCLAHHPLGWLRTGVSPSPERRPLRRGTAPGPLRLWFQFVRTLDIFLHRAQT